MTLICYLSVHFTRVGRGKSRFPSAFEDLDNYINYWPAALVKKASIMEENNGTSKRFFRSPSARCNNVVHSELRGGARRRNDRGKDHQ